jgi:hypothetical protein
MSLFNFGRGQSAPNIASGTPSLSVDEQFQQLELAAEQVQTEDDLQALTKALIQTASQASTAKSPLLPPASDEAGTGDVNDLGGDGVDLGEGNGDAGSASGEGDDDTDPVVDADGTDADGTDTTDPKKRKPAVAPALANTDAAIEKGKGVKPATAATNAQGATPKGATPAVAAIPANAELDGEGADNAELSYDGADAPRGEELDGAGADESELEKGGWGAFAPENTFGGAEEFIDPDLVEGDGELIDIVPFMNSVEKGLRTIHQGQGEIAHELGAQGRENSELIKGMTDLKSENRELKEQVKFLMNAYNSLPEIIQNAVGSSVQGVVSKALEPHTRRAKHVREEHSPSARWPTHLGSLAGVCCINEP